MTDLFDDDDLMSFDPDVFETVMFESSEPAKTMNVQKPRVGFTRAAFTDFLLKPELLRAIADAGFEHPSEVVMGNDVICQAKSGMGKTAVFVLGVLQQIDPECSDVVQAVVLCHTRELAYQICREFGRFAKYVCPDVRAAVFYGGIPVSVNRALLRQQTPQIVVGTPGRMKQLVCGGDLDLSGVRHFILDEADKMLVYTDMREDVQAIYKLTPRDKQVMLFSATFSTAAKTVCRKFTKNAIEVFVDSDSRLTLTGVRQMAKELAENEKNRALSDLLEALEYNQVVVFVRSQRRATELAALLNKCSFPAVAIHGRMPQKTRIERYEQFRTFQHRILVATDLIGRGIDVSHVNVVVNYDMPSSSDTYLHRVGRAGRFGTKGVAVSFVVPDVDAEVFADVKARFASESQVVMVNKMSEAC